MNNEDIKYLDYEGLVEYHNNITGKIFIPTIDYIPNETTLTYIVNDKTFKFDVGDFVRVTNSTKESGFTFYQLYDITEQNEAIWGSYSEKTLPTYVSPSAKNLTYDGSPLELLNPGSTSEGTFQYSLLTTNRRSATDSLSWSTSVPTATDANNYTVYWRLIGDESHEDILPTAISVEIEKVTPIISEYPEANTLTYNELFQELITPGQTNFGTFQYSFDETNWSTEIPIGLNANTYTVYYRILGDDNINTTETENLFVTISPKEIDNPGIVLSQNTYIYNGEECEPSVTLYDNQTEIPATEYTVSYQNNINVGTAEVIITNNSGGNYIVSGDTTFTINKANGRIDTLPTNKAVIYNSESQVLANAGLGTGVMYYSLEEHDNFSTTIPSLTNAGTYTLYFYAAESANYLQSATQNITVTISKAIPSYTSPQGKDNLIYSGESLELLIEGSSSDGIIKYSDDEGETWTTNIPEGTNAAIYNILWKVFGDSNHNDSNTFTINISIAKVTPTIIAPTLIENLVYNGEAQELLNEGSTNWGILLYSNDNETFSTTIPTGTNAGSYDIWYRVQGDSNINDVPSVKLTNSIAKVDACYVAPTAVTGLVYDESSHALLNVGSSTCGTIQYSADGTNWSSNIPEGTNAGDYTSYWKVVGDSNHIDKSSASITTNIDKALGEIYTAPTPISGLIYNNSALNLITSGSGTGTMQYKVDSGSWESSIPAMTNVKTSGDYIIYYRAIESANYYATDGTDYITNNIAKITLTITSPVPRVLTYNTSSLALVIAGDIAPEWAKTYVSMKYSLNGTTWSTNVPEAINYGSYTVYYKVDGNSNINDVPSAYVACSIAEKRVTVPTITSDSTYNYVYSGTAKTPTVVVKDGDVVVDPSEYTVTYLNNINAGTATIVISDNEGGNYNITGTQDFIISKAPGYVNPKPQANNLTYNESSQVLIDITNVLSSGTMMYRLGSSGDFSTTVPSATNAADTYTVYFYAAESNNYLQSIPTESVNITIAEKSIVIPTPTGYSAQYDGNAHTATFGSATGASITKYRYSTDNSTWTESSSNPSITNVGTLYTQAYYTAETNYTGSGWSSSATLSVSRKTSASVSTTTELTYNGTTESNGSAQTGVSGSYVSLSGTTSATNAGSYTAYATPTSNYAWSDGTHALKTINWSIARRGQTAPVLNGASAVFHNTATASVKTSGTVSGGTATAPGTLTWSNQSRTAVGSQTATAYYAATATNFSASPTSEGVTVQITQASDASVSVTLSGTLTYNGSAQTLATATSHGCTYYLALGSNGTSAPSSGWTNGPISATNAGTYYIWYKGTKDGNHSNDIGATYIGSAVVINKANQSAPSATGSTVTYGSTATATATGGGGQGSIEWSNGSSRTAVGYQDTQARWSGNANYNASGWSSSVRLQVNQAGGWVTASATNRTYSGSGQVVGSVSSASGTYYLGFGGSTTSGPSSWGSANSSISATNAGTYYIWAKCDASTNYTAVSAKYIGTATIGKANQNAPSASGSTTTYPTTATASASGGGGQGSIQWESALSQTSVGSHTTRARWTGNANYNASGWSSYVTVLMNKANQNAPTATGASVTYGNTATASASGGGGQGSIEWSNGNTLTGNVGSKTTKARWTGNGNYNASGWSNEVTLAITKANLNAPTATGATVNYGSTATATATGGGGLGSIEWSNGNTRTAAGSQTTKARWSGNSNYNASPWSNEVTLTVNSKTPGSVNISENTVYYGSGDYLLSVSSPTGTMHYKVGNKSWLTSIPTATLYLVPDAGSCTVYWYMDETSSYTGIGSASSPQSVTCTVIKTLCELELTNGSTVFISAGTDTSLKLTHIASYKSSIRGISTTKYCSGIDSDCFNGCSSLRTVDLTDGVGYISDRSFANCTNIDSVLLGLNLTSIGKLAFSYSGMDTFYLPENLTYMGENVFYGCPYLTCILAECEVAPTILNNTFAGIPENGELRLQDAHNSWNTWMQTSAYYLGYYDWTIGY